MWVEAVPHQISREIREKLHGTVFQPLTALLSDWSRRG